MKKLFLNKKKSLILYVLVIITPYLLVPAASIIFNTSFGVYRFTNPSNLVNDAAFYNAFPWIFHALKLSGHDLNTTNTFGDTPIYEAIRMSSYNALVSLYDLNADPNIKPSDYIPPEGVYVKCTDDSPLEYSLKQLNSSDEPWEYLNWLANHDNTLNGPQYDLSHPYPDVSTNFRRLKITLFLLSKRPWDGVRNKTDEKEIYNEIMKLPKELREIFFPLVKIVRNEDVFIEYIKNDFCKNEMRQPEFHLDLPDNENYFTKDELHYLSILLK